PKASRCRRRSGRPTPGRPRRRRRTDGASGALAFPLQTRSTVLVPKRAALAQALFREINERSEERVPLFGGSEVRLGIVSQCANIDCQERILIAKSAYEEARREPTHFIVKPGHIVSEVEERVS